MKLTGHCFIVITPCNECKNGKCDRHPNNPAEWLGLAEDSVVAILFCYGLISSSGSVIAQFCSDPTLCVLVCVLLMCPSL